MQLILRMVIIAGLSLATVSSTQAQMTAEQNSASIYKGVEAMKTGNNAVAISEFSRLISATPTNGEYYAMRGAVYLAQNNYRKAEDDFSNAIKYGDNRTLTKESLNTAVAFNLSGPINSSGKTVKEIIDTARQAAVQKDYKKAIGYTSILVGQKKPEVRHTGLYLRAAMFLSLKMNANARTDIAAMKREGAQFPDLPALEKAAAGPGNASITKPSTPATSALTTSSNGLKPVPKGGPKTPQELKEYLKRF